MYYSVYNLRWISEWVQTGHACAYMCILLTTETKQFQARPMEKHQVVSASDSHKAQHGSNRLVSKLLFD